MTVRYLYKFKTKFDINCLPIRVNCYLVLRLYCVLKVIYGQQVAPSYVDEDDHSDNGFVITPAPSVNRQTTIFGHRQKGDSVIYQFFYANGPPKPNSSLESDLVYPPEEFPALANITCIEVVDIRTYGGLERVSIKNGGLGYRNATIHLTSMKDQGFNVEIRVYGRTKQKYVIIKNPKESENSSDMSREDSMFDEAYQKELKRKNQELGDLRNPPTPMYDEEEYYERSDVT